MKQSTRLPAAECIQLGLSLTSALGHLHRHGLIHRDIKPSNIIFVQSVPKLADIGLVVEVEEAFSFVGTEGYIPPEGPTSPQADLYSLGKVLYEASNGKDRKEFPEPMTGLRELPDRSEREMLLELNAVILKACAEDLRERYQSAEEFHADLALIQSGKSVRRRRRLETRVAILTRVALVVGLAALVGFGGYAFQRQQTAAARRLSQENRQLAEAESQQRARAENALLNTQLQRAQEFLGEQKNAAALTRLAQLLRRHPTSRFIAEQILSTLSSRNFALPIARLSDSNELTRARFSADGSRVVTASRNGTARVWDARTGRPISSTLIRDGGARADISRDGEWIAMAGQGEVRVASARTGKVEAMLGAEGKIDRVAFNGNGSRLLIVKSNEASITEVQTGQQIAGPFRHDGIITSAVFSVAGDRILTSSQSNSTARLWDAQTGRVIRTFEHKPFFQYPTAPKLSPDGTRVITLLTTAGMGGNAARIWNANTGEALSDPIDCTFPIRVIEFSPDGTRVIIGGNGRLAWVCDGHTGQRLAGPFEYEEAISAAKFSFDGRKIVAGCATGVVRIWDSATGEMLTNPFGHGPTSRSHSVDALEFSPNGEHLLVLERGTAWLWDVRPGPAQSLILPHDDAVTFAQFSLDGRRIVTAMDERINSGVWNRPTTGRAALVWDAHSGQRLTPPLVHDRGVVAAALSPDGERVVTTSWDRTAKLWNAETGEPLCEPLFHPTPVRSVLFSKDGTRLWTGCWDHSAWVWNGENGKLIRKLLESDGQRSDFHGFPHRSDDLSPDQKWIVTCSGMPRGDAAKGLIGMQVWNARTGEPRYLREPFSHPTRKARFSPDGERFVTSSASAQSVYIWNARTGELLIGPLDHKGPIHYAEFSPDGTKVVTAGNDGTARIWDSRTGRMIAQPLLHKGEVVHAAFSPDGKRIVTASWWDHAAFIWDAETGFQIGEPLQHEDWVTYATFSPDGKWVVTTSADQTARIWEVSVATANIPEWLAELAEAIAGQRIDDNGTSQPVALEKLLELRARLSAGTGTNEITHWAKWFFADRSTRAASAFSQNIPSQQVR